LQYRINVKIYFILSNNTSNTRTLFYFTSDF